MTKMKRNRMPASAPHVPVEQQVAAQVEACYHERDLNALLADAGLLGTSAVALATGAPRHIDGKTHRAPKFPPKVTDTFSPEPAPVVDLTVYETAVPGLVEESDVTKNALVLLAHPDEIEVKPLRPSPEELILADLILRGEQV